MQSKSLSRILAEDNETNIKKKILIWLNRNIPGRAFIYKIADRWRSGVPDIMIVYMGHVIFIEVKRPGQNPTPKQDHTMVQLRAAGAITAVIHSVEEIKKFASDIFLLQEERHE